MNEFTQLDGNLLIDIQEFMHADWLTPVMKVITYFGEDGYFWIAICLLLLLFKRTRRLGIICSLSLAFTFLCCNLIIKPTVDRTRPWIVFREVVRLLSPPGDASFPSGHSANAMGPAWALFLASLPVRPSKGEAGSYDYTPCLGWQGDGADPKIVHRFGNAAVILALLIGLSRLYLGMHYPSDVAAGLLLGMICATVVFFAIRMAESRRGTLIGEGKPGDDSAKEE